MAVERQPPPGHFPSSMSTALTKTLSLLLLILVGYVMQRKLKNKEEREGIKTVILSLALPATILIALLQIDFASDLIIIPIMSLAFNVIVYQLVRRLPLQSMLQIEAHRYRTLVMLIPSLAPGLSCFPFIIEYSGQGPLAMAALADVGNKIFVLIVSYTIAMQWYYDVNKKVQTNRKSKFKDLLAALVNEPVNLVITVAIVMLAFGFNFNSFPAPVSQGIDKLSAMMTPLILLFIGLSMKLTWEQVRTIVSFLCFRSTVAFIISAAVLYFFPANDLATQLLIVVFPQSACSFWPYAHMAAVGKLETKLNTDNPQRTFDLDFAMNVLACSLPFSVVLIMIIYASGEIFAQPGTVLMTALLFAGAGLLTIVLAGVSTAESKRRREAVVK